MRILRSIKVYIGRLRDRKSQSEYLWVYTDKQGNRWYAHKDPLQMSVNRLQDLKESEDFLRLNITHEWACDLVAKLKECINSGNIIQAGLLLTDFEFRLSMNWSKYALLHFCASYYLINNEPFDPSVKCYDQKKQLIDESIELQDFFLTDVFERHGSLVQGLREDFENYLRDKTKMDKMTWNLSFSPYLIREMSSTKPAS